MLQRPADCGAHQRARNRTGGTMGYRAMPCLLPVEDALPREVHGHVVGFMVTWRVSSYATSPEWDWRAVPGKGIRGKRKLNRQEQRDVDWMYWEDRKGGNRMTGKSHDYY